MPIIHAPTGVYVSAVNVCWFSSRSALSFTIGRRYQVSICDSFVLLANRFNHFNKIGAHFNSDRTKLVHIHTQTHERTHARTTPNEWDRIKWQRRKNMPKAFKNDLKFNYSAFCTTMAAATVCTINLKCHTRNSHIGPSWCRRVSLPSNRIRKQSFWMPKRMLVHSWCAVSNRQHAEQCHTHTHTSIGIPNKPTAQMKWVRKFFLRTIILWDLFDVVESGYVVHFLSFLVWDKKKITVGALPPAS